MDSELPALGLRSAVDSGMPVKEHSGMGFGIDCFLRENNQYVQAEVDWERDVSVVAGVDLEVGKWGGFADGWLIDWVVEGGEVSKSLRRSILQTSVCKQHSTWTRAVTTEAEKL